MKSKKDTKQNPANQLASNIQGFEANNSLQSSLESPNPITIPNNNGQLASFHSPEYELEKEEKSELSKKNGQLTNEDGNGDENKTNGGTSQDESGDGIINIDKGKKEEKEKKSIEESKKTKKEKNNKRKEKTKEGKKKVKEKKENDKEKISKGKKKKKERVKNIIKEKSKKKGKKDSRIGNLKSHGAKNSIAQAVDKNSNAQTEASVKTSNINSQKGLKSPMPPQKKKGGDYVVGAGGVGLFSESQIINKTPEGNAVVHAENGLSGEQSKHAKPLPKAVIQEKIAQRKATNSAGITSFSSQAGAKIALTKSIGARQSSMFGLQQATAINEIEVSAQSAVSRVDTNVSSAIGEITSSFDSLKQSIENKAQTIIESINAKEIAISASIDQEVISANEKCKELGMATLDEVESIVSNEIDRVNNVANQKGEEAVAKARAAADCEQAEPLKEQSTWEDIKNGGRYEENKRRARVEACLQVGQDTKREFIRKAEDAAAILLQNKSQIRSDISQTIASIGDDISSQADGAKSSLAAHKEQLITSVNSQKEQQCSNLENNKVSSIDAITSLGSSKKAEILKSAGKLKANVVSTVAQTRKQFSQTLQGSISQLSSTKMQLVQMMSSQVEASENDFAKMQNQMSAKFNSANQNIQQSIISLGSSSRQSILQSGSQGGSSILELSQGATESVNQHKNNALNSARNIVQNSMTTLDQLNASANQGLDGLLNDVKNTFKSITSDAAKQFGQAKLQIASSITADVDKVIQEYSSTLSKLDSVLIEKANEAEAKVRPRWKTLISVVVDVLAALALAAVVFLLVTSGVGIILTIVIAVAAGAALGVGKQLINNALDGKPLGEDVLKAAAIGGVEGLFAALTGGAGSQIASRIGAKLGTAVAGRIASFGQRAVVKVASEVLTGIAEDASKHIVGNLFHKDKSWNDGLLRMLGASTINRLIGVGASNLTGRVGSSNALGSQVNEGFRRRASREMAEFGIDFTGKSIVSGVDGFINDFDLIMSGDKGLFDSISDGVIDNAEKNLIGTSTRNLNGYFINGVRDRRAQRQLAETDPNRPDLDDGYRYSTDNTGKLGIRKTHQLGEDGVKIADLTYTGPANRNSSADINNSEGNDSTPTPTSQNNAESQISQTLPDAAANHAEGPNSQLETENSPISSERINQSNADDSSPTNSNNQQNHDDSENSSRSLSDSESEQRDSRSQHDSDGYSRSRSGQLARQRGLPPAPEGYHYSTSQNDTLYIRRTRVNDSNGNTRPQLTIDGNRLVPINDNSNNDSKTSFKPGWNSDRVVNFPKNERPPVTDYLDSEYIAEHLRNFENGASRIVLKRDYEKYGIGKPDEGRTEFVSTKAEIDAILSLPLVEQSKRLGIPVEQLQGGEVVRIDFTPTDKIEMPTGNEFGANDQWMAGGKLPEGNLEAVIKTEEMLIDIDFTVNTIK